MNSGNYYRLALGLGIGALLVLIWLSLGVGIIGADGDRANRMYLGVLAVGVIGAGITRMRPKGMSRVLAAMAIAQGTIAIIALVAGLGLPWSGPLEIVILNGFFVATFAASAWLFMRAEQSA